MVDRKILLDTDVKSFNMKCIKCKQAWSRVETYKSCIKATQGFPSTALSYISSKVTIVCAPLSEKGVWIGSHWSPLHQR